MILKNHTTQTIIRISIIALCIVGASLLWFTFHNPWASIILGIAAIFQIILLIRYLNQLNYKLSFFLEGIKNEDGSLHFPETRGDPSLIALHHSLNKVNRLLGEVRRNIQIQEHYYQSIIDQVSVGILVLKPSGEIEMANKAAAGMLGYAQIHHLRQLERLSSQLVQTFRNILPGEHRVEEIRLPKEKANLLILATSITHEKDSLKILSLQNISNQLDENETESWVRLIRVLTHEIMNSIAPITSLSGTLIDILQKSCPDGTLNPEDSEDMIQALEVIKERSNGLISFVDSYRKLTRLPKPAKTLIEVAPLFDQVKILTSNYPNFSNVAFHVDVKSGLTIDADYQQLQQLLINLLKNALEALREKDDARIHIKAYRTATGEVLLQVTDNGPGIPEEYQEKVFIPFFTTREEGSGIGLSLSRQIMRLHGGTIRLTSSVGQGTTFTLKFPML